MLNKYSKSLFLSFFVFGTLFVPFFILAQGLFVDAGQDQTVYENQSIILNGSIYGNKTGEQLNYYWSCTGGSLTDSNTLQPILKAPNVNENTKIKCTLSVRNNSKDYSDSVNILIRKYRLPLVDLKANGYDGPINLQKGGFVTLTWEVSNAISCYANDNWSGSKAFSGFEKKVNIDYSQKFTLTCSNPGGSVSDTIEINIPNPDAPGVGIWANNSRISVSPYYKNPISLKWTSDKADACYASGDWYGTKETNGVETISNITSLPKTFVITCLGKNNLRTSTQVTVKQK